MRSICASPLGAQLSNIDFHAVARQGTHITEGESSVAIVAMRDTDEGYAVLSLFVTLTDTRDECCPRPIGRSAGYSGAWRAVHRAMSHQGRLTNEDPAALAHHLNSELTL